MLFATGIKIKQKVESHHFFGKFLGTNIYPPGWFIGGTLASRGPNSWKKKNHEIYANGWRTKLQVHLSWLIHQVHLSMNLYKWLNYLIDSPHDSWTWHFLACLHFPSSRLHSQTIDASTSPEEFRARPLRYNAFLGRQKHHQRICIDLVEILEDHVLQW